MNIFIVDIETAGLDPQKHEIIEIACVNASTGETFSEKVLPLHISDADPKALDINGYTHEAWKDEAYLLPNVLKLLNQFIGQEQAYFMAYGVSFDWAFMQQAYVRTGIRDPFHYHHLDLLTLAWKSLPAGSSLSLKNVCESLGISPEPLVHRALGGALCAYEVYKKL